MHDKSTKKDIQLSVFLGGSGGGGVKPEGTKQIEIVKNGTVTEDVANFAEVEVTVAVPDAMTDVLNGAIVDYTNDGAYTVHDYAFYEQRNLTHVSMANVQSIRSYAFYRSGLTRIDDTDFPVAESMSSYAFADLEYLSSAVFPTVRNVGSYAFSYCSTLANAKFPAATLIDNCAFERCKNLPGIELPNVACIMDYAFRNCYLLQYVIAPKAMEICANAFYSCDILDTLVVGTELDGYSCFLYDANAFACTPIASGTGYIYVPDYLVDEYKNATNWSVYAEQIRPYSEYPGKK